MNLRAEIDALSHVDMHYFNERLTSELANRVISPGDTVLDLGANVGYHTDNFSRLVGPGGRVHAFEPNPQLWPHLQRWRNVRVWPVAVGAELGIATLHVPVGDNLDQVASLIDTTMFGPTSPHTVPVVAVDLLPEIDTVSFVKIDVERYELQALNGMKALIERCAPVIVYEGNTSEIEAFLTTLGYTAYQLAGDLHPKDRCPVANWIACPPERVAQIMLGPEFVANLIEEITRPAAPPAAVVAEPVVEPVLEKPLAETVAASPAAAEPVPRSWLSRLLSPASSG